MLRVMVWYEHHKNDNRIKKQKSANLLQRDTEVKHANWTISNRRKRQANKLDKKLVQNGPKSENTSALFILCRVTKLSEEMSCTQFQAMFSMCRL